MNVFVITCWLYPGWFPAVYAAVEGLIHAAPAGFGSGDGELSPLSPPECSLKHKVTKVVNQIKEYFTDLLHSYNVVGLTTDSSSKYLNQCSKTRDIVFFKLLLIPSN